MSFHGPFLTFLENTPEVVVALLGGMIAVAIHYRKTGRFPLGRLPWKSIKLSAHFITTEYFSRPRPKEVPALVVTARKEEVEGVLRAKNYESGDLYSFEYQDEVLNFRRPEGLYGDDEIASEVHARGFLTNDGRVLVLAHHEASRYEEWKNHIRGGMLSWERGREIVTGDLSEFDVEKVESEEAGNITIVSEVQ